MKFLEFIEWFFVGESKKEKNEYDRLISSMDKRSKHNLKEIESSITILKDTYLKFDENVAILTDKKEDIVYYTDLARKENYSKFIYNIPRGVRFTKIYIDEKYKNTNIFNDIIFPSVFLNGDIVFI